MTLARFSFSGAKAGLIESKGGCGPGNLALGCGRGDALQRDAERQNKPRGFHSINIVENGDLPNEGHLLLGQIPSGEPGDFAFFHAELREETLF